MSYEQVSPPLYTRSQMPGSSGNPMASKCYNNQDSKVYNLLFVRTQSISHSMIPRPPSKTGGYSLFSELTDGRSQGLSNNCHS